MRHFWKFLTLLLFLGLNRPVPAYFDGGFEQYWTASTSVYDDGERVYATGTTEAPFEVFWTQVSTSLNGPGGGASGYDHSYGSWAGVQVSVPINGNYGYYSAYSTHAVMDTDGLADYDYSQGYDYVQAPPPPPAPPSISGLSPSSAVAGTSGSVQVSGSGFRPGATLSSSGSGLSVNGSYSSSNSSISGNYTAATPGNYSVYVTQDTGTAGATFTVGTPTPRIDSISQTSVSQGDVADSIVISGAGFGASPTVDISPSSGLSWTYGSRSNTQVTIYLSVAQNADPTARSVTVNWGNPGQGFISVGGTTATSMPASLIILQRYSFCGDTRDMIIDEYPRYGASTIPGCYDFTQSAGSAHFAFATLNTSDYLQWAILRGGLLDGLEGTWTGYVGSLSVTSAYRNPARNFRVGNPSDPTPNSQHVYGTAVDFASTLSTFYGLRNKGIAAGACAEPLNLSLEWHVHLDWRPGGCPAGWQQ